jgi:TRAP-type uncharacterized transport system substrate-binding protein
MTLFLRVPFVLIFFSISILAASQPRADDLRFFKIASGSPVSTYFPIASLIGKVISNTPGS